MAFSTGVNDCDGTRAGLLFPEAVISTTDDARGDGKARVLASELLRQFVRTPLQGRSVLSL